MPTPGGPRPQLEFPLLTADDVARTMLGGMPVKTINQYAREGRIPSIWIGKHRRFNRPAVEEAIARAASRGGRLYGPRAPCRTRAALLIRRGGDV